MSHMTLREDTKDVMMRKLNEESGSGLTFYIDETKDSIKIVGMDGKSFRSFAYVGKNSTMSDAKTSIQREYREYKFKKGL